MKHTKKETFLYRCYAKHFHPDLFLSHPAHALAMEKMKLVNQAYDQHAPRLEQFIVSTGLQLKTILRDG